MSLENLVGADKFIANLVVTNPTGGDDKREGDDHIRGVKNVLRNSFPNINAAVTATAAELSGVTGKVSKTGDLMSGRLTIKTPNGDSVPLWIDSIDVAGTQMRVNWNGNLQGAMGCGDAIAAGLPSGDIALQAQGSVHLYANAAGTQRRVTVNPAGCLIVANVSALSLTGAQAALATGIQPNCDVGLIVKGHGDGVGFGIRCALSTASGANLLGWHVDFYNGAGVKSGGIYQNTASSVQYAASSDYRLKSGIGALKGAARFISALRPVAGRWQADGTPFVGFLAHELAEVSPSSVVGDKDARDTKGAPILQCVAYASSELIANIVAELQSLRAEVEQLRAALEGV
jgi:Chaperone of endosialidase